MKTHLVLVFLAVYYLCGCSFAGPEERAIAEMMKTFVAAIQQDDEGLAKALLLDMEGFQKLNPDVAARVDAEAFTEAVYAELIYSYRGLADYFRGRELKMKRVTLGNNWYQHKGRRAFKNNEVIISADGEEVSLFIKGLVNIDGQWRIVELSGIDFLE